MKILLTSALMLLTPALALAQAPAKKAPVAKTAKTAPARTVAKGAAPAAAAVAATAAADTPLSPEQQAIAQEVHTGLIACELGASVSVEPDTQAPGRFYVQGKGFRYHMTPAVSATGAIRLEDARAGAVWLQIANKSMLMNQKLGQRMADECMSAHQSAVAQAMKTNPPQSLFDAPPGK